MAALAMTESPRPFYEAGRELLSRRKRLLDELRRAASTLEAREACAQLILSGDEALDKLTVHKLVEACKGVGPGRAKLLLLVAGVDGGTKLVDLRIKDAQRLAATLRGER